MRNSLLAVSVIALIWLEAPAWAQFNRNSSSLGSSSMKSSSSSTSMFGNLFSSSISAKMSSGTSTSGTSTSGKSTSGTSTSGTSTSDNLLRSSRGAANFVGADANDNRNFLGYTDASSSSSRSSRSSSNTSLRRSTTSSTNANSTQRTSYGTTRNRQSSETIRPTLQVGFEYEGPSSQALTPRLAARLAKAPFLRNLPPIDFTVDKGIVTLKGAVRTEHDRVLLEQLVLQEPGVRQVENLLTVAATDSSSPVPNKATP